MTYFWLSCLHRMRTTFLLPLARMLEAFYRAIKTVNQSLLNDPRFLTCFTGSDTVVAAHCTHGFTLCGLPTLSIAVWTRNTVCDHVIALLVPGLHGYITEAFTCNSKGNQDRRAEEQEQEQEDPVAGVGSQLPMYSCRDAFAIV